MKEETPVLVFHGGNKKMSRIFRSLTAVRVESLGGTLQQTLEIRPGHRLLESVERDAPEPVLKRSSQPAVPSTRAPTELGPLSVRPGRDCPESG